MIFSDRASSSPLSSFAGFSICSSCRDRESSGAFSTFRGPPEVALLPRASGLANARQIGCPAFVVEPPPLLHPSPPLISGLVSERGPVRPVYSFLFRYPLLAATPTLSQKIKPVFRIFRFPGRLFLKSVPSPTLTFKLRIFTVRSTPCNADSPDLRTVQREPRPRLRSHRSLLCGSLSATAEFSFSPGE